MNEHLVVIASLQAENDRLKAENSKVKRQLNKTVKTLCKSGYCPKPLFLIKKCWREALDSIE